MRQEIRRGAEPASPVTRLPRRLIASFAVVVGVPLILALAAPGLAQQREYYLRGKVLDTGKNPVPGVELVLRDDATSRSFNVKTDKQGAFRLAGLPHGIYQVTIVKDGYARRQDEWKFETPQPTMQTVEIPEIVLVSQTQIQEGKRLEQAAAGVKEATELLRKRDPDGALALLKDVLDKDPKDANALFLMGVTYGQKKMHREAVEAFTRVVELTPTFAPAFVELGLRHQQLGERPQALAAYEKALALEPGTEVAAYNAGLILFESDRIDEALNRFQTGLAVRPDDPDLLEMAGRCYLNQGRFKEAVAQFEKARAATSDAEKRQLLDELIRRTQTLG
jgi:tetratricopeptide (TPR) repeat protein